jgi:dipeptidyl aminopeptidase/acylaminoacyl peptidase
MKQNMKLNVMLKIFFASALCGMLSATATAADPYPLEYWALRDVVSNVDVSPGGNYVGLMKIAHRDANPVLEVYDASDFTKKPFTLNADPMEITSFAWVGDESLLVTFRQKVRDKIDGFNQGVYENELALLDVKRQKIDKINEVNPTLENILPNEPDKVILSFNPGGDLLSEVNPLFRPRAYYKFDLKTRSKQLLMQGKISMGNVVFNGNGEPWYARGYDRSTDELIWYLRYPGHSEWQEAYRQHEDEFFDFSVEGLVPGKPGYVYLLAHNGQDRTALWEFDYVNHKFGEMVFGHPEVDVSGVRRHSNAWTNPDTIVGAAYGTDKYHFEYFDAIEAATYAQLEGVIPDAYYLRIPSRSRDGNTLIIYNVGPHDPGTYYLLKEGKLQTVGSRQPLLKSEDLADVRYVNYKARDGRKIYGYVTVPRGEPPFPLVVLPHGGPFVSEVVVWDEWSQMLANNGYLVLQPQYRGSRNYGLEYYTSAFRDSGQGGYAMQDDKDDGALYLVEQGLAVRDRMAMFGWSYGGYAALVAASRTPQIYQCVIAGAAVSDPLMQVSYYSDIIRGASATEQINMWQDSISPLKEASKVNVPLLLIHGDVDQRVPPAHAKKYRGELDKYGKNYKYVELKGADHFSNTLFYDHQLLLYTSIIDYLKGDCGPGGL